ncbi:hypothetical protein M752DRAFT_120594 [Aspergillus phoenicis ATCC 13157]|uniref:Uncharacterized protein n=1 Tax=Aspergillus phoenicis ATCC 13157 TaxID=1353007 RepID=A0A370PTV4_ASPPH|nr:hypothetical protein M752DRAFT_120594 [Aspergillus phoenicis ATCC 13157]
MHVYAPALRPRAYKNKSAGRQSRKGHEICKASRPEVSVCSSSVVVLVILIILALLLFPPPSSLGAIIHYDNLIRRDFHHANPISLLTQNRKFSPSSYLLIRTRPARARESTSHWVLTGSPVALCDSSPSDHNVGHNYHNKSQRQIYWRRFYVASQIRDHQSSIIAADCQEP